MSSVESWFFSSLGWKVPMPTRSFSERISRFTTTWRISFSQLPSYWVMRSWNVLRQNGHRLPVFDDAVVARRPAAG